MSVREIIRPCPHTLRPCQTIEHAAHELERDDCGAMLVVDDGRVVGILTERDVVRRIVAMGLDATKATVADAMSQHVVSVAPDESAEVADRRLRANKVRHLVVTDPEEGPLGVLDTTDLLRWHVRSLVGELRSLEPSLCADTRGF